MLEKILDKYYTKKLMKQMKEYLDVFSLDKRIVYHKDYATLEVKRRKWKEENYIIVYSCLYDKALVELINLSEIEINNLRENISKIIKE